MAVIQISKIQQRRGQKLLTGMPQLSSGELAWAVDTQELYIGNGSLTEGAPYVGNTKILTEHDNILELADSYRFANDYPAIIYSVPRTLQSKIDEIEVSVLDFGAPIDGQTDCTLSFSRAIDELFNDPDDVYKKYRKVLKIPNGIYKFLSVFKIPSDVVLRGETRDGVILNVGSTGIEFTSKNNTDPVFFDTDDRPENITLSNFTILYTEGQTNISSSRNCVLENLRFIKGYFNVNGDLIKSYQLGNEVGTPIQAAQDYSISDIRAGGRVTVTYPNNLGGTLTATIVFNSADENESPTTVIQRLVDEINIAVNSNFTAELQAESLVIKATFASGLEASDIDQAFTVDLDATGLGIPGVITPTATELSTGIEEVAAAVSWNNTDKFSIRTTGITFNDCLFSDNEVAVKCLQTTAFSAGTEINFNHCRFFSCDTGVYVQDRPNQVNNWKFFDCEFEQISKRAIFSTNGIGIVVNRASVKDCGNNDAGPNNPAWPIFEFGKKYGNVLIDIVSDRHQISGIVLDSYTNETVGFLDAKNAGTVSFSNEFHSLIQTTPDNVFEPLAVFSSDNRYIEIDYILTIGSAEQGLTRKGKLTLVIDDTPDEIALSDNFTYSSPYHDDRDLGYSGGTIMTSFEFKAELKDNNGDSVIDTVLLSYKNPQSISQEGEFSYTLTYGV